LPSFPRLFLLAGLFSAAANYTTIEHAFILADNRHYVFYIWRRLFKDRLQPYSLYLYPIVYALCFLLIMRSIHRSQNKLLSRRVSWWWAILWLIAAACVLIPSPLVEPRYFEMPLLVACLGIRVCSQVTDESGSRNNGQRKRIIWDMLWIGIFIVLNGVTLYVFVFRSFVWPDGSVARFLW
jgi:alpha-1,2-glucosyltransferase